MVTAQWLLLVSLSVLLIYSTSAEDHEATFLSILIVIHFMAF
jgi:hypothetical protein